MKESSVQRPHLFPSLRDWPIYKLHARRKAFVRELEDEALRQLPRGGARLIDVLQETLFGEKTRVRKEPWKIDPPGEIGWWRRAERKLVEAGLDEGDADEDAERRRLLRRIVRRYAEEVVGDFRIQTFQQARRILTFFFNRLLNTAAGRNWRRFVGAKARLSDRLIVSGQVERVRRLFPDHHVVICPTHFSNLDSAIIGYGLDTFAGIPHSTYGAGLNLMNTGWVAYFFNRLGVYRVDRRKKNPIYLEVLKSFSRLAIYNGVNSIFYPGGTRSRSGALERDVKLGLLGTAVEAQRRLLAEGREEKVVIVPLVVSYHFVLEAKFLIQEHLRRTGREQYVGAPSRQFSYRSVLRFLWQLFSTKSEIYLNLGQPLDVLGNPLDDAGRSLDARGQPLDLAEYFRRDGALTADAQREREYTRMLGDAVVDRFHRDHVVLTSHVVAYVAFRTLTQFHPDLDLYGVLRLVEEDFLFDLSVMRRLIEAVQARLLELEAAGELQLSAAVRDDPNAILRDGIAHMSLYHQRLPLSMAGGRLVSQDYHLLYYYHNRLSGYPLRQASTIDFGGDVRSVRAARLAMLDADTDEDPDAEPELELEVAT